jgi:phosphohistidine phosphatase
VFVSGHLAGPTLQWHRGCTSTKLFLVHHGDAVGPEVDSRRPLSEQGQREVGRLATEAAARGTRPDVVWHSGKLRARQTAEAFWRVCNPLAAFSAARDLQPDDPPAWILNQIRAENRDVMIAGHMPHIARLLQLLVPDTPAFPPHGIVALESSDGEETWRELWRIENG